MGRNAPLAPTPGARPQQLNGPGSNGYWRRDGLFGPGTFQFRATKAGKVKVQMIGSASGANGDNPGASGGFGDKTLTVAIGDLITIVLGDGGVGRVSSTTVASADGGASSISGTPVGGTPLVIAGAKGGTTNGTTPFLGGVPSGPWDKSFSGASYAGTGVGSPASASPRGPGVTSTGFGGAGWGGRSETNHGGSSHRPSLDPARAPPGLLAMPMVERSGGAAVNTFYRSQDQSCREFWDLADVDSAGGSAQPDTNNAYNLPSAGGPGAGGAGTASGAGAPSSLGGGTGRSNSGIPPASGFGAGGGACTNGTGGPGGAAMAFVFWDEVI